MATTRPIDDSRLCRGIGSRQKFFQQVDGIVEEIIVGVSHPDPEFSPKLRAEL
jgi:hypothetical protein